MKADRSSAERDKLRARIRGTGLRCTPARLAVLGQLSTTASPLSHAEIANRTASLGIDRATVYRNLVEMAEAGLLSRVDLGDHVWRFELRAEGREHGGEHPHFVCTECGEVSCLSGVEISIKPAAGKKRSAVGEITEILLKGLCSHCA